MKHTNCLVCRTQRFVVVDIDVVSILPALVYNTRAFCTTFNKLGPTENRELEEKPQVGNAGWQEEAGLAGYLLLLVVIVLVLLLLLPVFLLVIVILLVVVQVGNAGWQEEAGLAGYQILKHRAGAGFL